MTEVTTIGLELAKHVFQVNGADSEGRPVLRKRVGRATRRRCSGAFAPRAVGRVAGRRQRGNGPPAGQTPISKIHDKCATVYLT